MRIQTQYRDLPISQLMQTFYDQVIIISCPAGTACLRLQKCNMLPVTVITLHKGKKISNDPNGAGTVILIHKTLRLIADVFLLRHHCQFIPSKSKCCT